MKYPAHIYAKAFVETMAEAPKAKREAIARNFIAVVRKNGDEVSLKKILEEAARLERARTGIRKVTFESARPLTAAQRKKLIRFAAKGDVIEERVDPGLVAGMRIFLDDEREFDGSLAGKLNVLFNTN